MNKRSSLSGKKNREKTVNTVCFLLVVFFSALCLLPIWWIFRSSLMTNNQLYSSNVPFLPPDWLFSNYSQALKNFPFWTYLKNTLTILVIFAILYYVAGISYKVIAIIVLILTLAGGSLALYLFNVETKPFFLRDYQWERVIAFRSTDNESSQDDNRQQLNSVMAIGSGMLTGKGLISAAPASSSCFSWSSSNVYGPAAGRRTWPEG